jgi:cytochrome c2
VTATPRPLSSRLADIEAEYAALPPGDAEAGRTSFTSAGCAACHALEPEKRIMGPALAGIGARAAGREPGLSAELYLYKSLTRPDAYVVESFTPGLMPQTFSDTLTPQTQADLLAFLLTLK